MDGRTYTHTHTHTHTHTGGKIFKNSFFYRTLPVAASEILQLFFHFFASLYATKKIQKQPFPDVLQNRCSYKFRQINRRTPVLGPVLFSQKFIIICLNELKFYFATICVELWSIPFLKTVGGWRSSVQLFICNLE